MVVSQHLPDAYWKELSPESAVLARVFIEHCMETKNEARLEAASLPVVTAFAFHLQEAYNILLGLLQDAENAKMLNVTATEQGEEAERQEEELAKQEVILAELLRMSLKLDYMDEIGRRKVFTVVRKYLTVFVVYPSNRSFLGDMLAHPELPLGLIEPSLDVLKGILPTERELIRVVVEIIIELREEENQENIDACSVRQL